MPQNDRLLDLALSLPRLPISLLLLVAKQMERIDRPVLITLANLKLLLSLRESSHKVIPVGQVISVVVV